MIDIIPQASYYIFLYLFSLKIFHSLKGIEFHWSHISSKEQNKISLILRITFILTIICFFGIFETYFLITIYILYIYCYSKSSFYSLGDAYITPLLIYLIFRGDSSFDGNFDNLFIFKDNYFPELFVTLFTSLIFFSAGFEKRKSEIWKKNNAVKLFFFNPKFRKISLPNFESENLFKITTPLILYSQLLLVFFLIFLPLKLTIIPLIILLIFIIILGIFFHYSDLTLPSFIALCIILYTVLKIDNIFIASYFINNFTNSDYLEKFIIIIFTFLFFISLFIVLLPQGKFSMKNSIIFLKKIVRYSIGLTKIDVYTENHIDNQIVQKFYMKKKNKITEIFRLYNNDGTPYLKNTFFLPTAYLAISFRLLDVLSQLDHEKKLSHENLSFLTGVISFLIKKYKVSEFPISIIVSIYQINIPSLIENNNKLKNNYTPVLEIKVNRNNKMKIKKIRNKILKFKTKRSKEKKRYKFG